MEVKNTYAEHAEALRTLSVLRDPRRRPTRAPALATAWPAALRAARSGTLSSSRKREGPLGTLP
jgi:hypothetical protein